MKQTLLDQIASKHNLLNAWGKLNKLNKSSHGLSGETIRTFSDNIEDKISSISKKLLSGKYYFSKTRAVAIPKSNGKVRPLQVPEVSDRLVIKSIAIELENIFTPLLKTSSGISFAYQKNTGIRDAIERIKEIHNAGNNYVLEADIIDFYGSVNKDSLLKLQILPQLPDDSINDLIMSSLSQEVGGLELIKKEDRKYFENLNSGIPQGNALSPLFSNIYLSPFDLEMSAKGYALVRYADDFVVLCDNQDKCQQSYIDCQVILKKLNLEIHPIDDKTKTKIINLSGEYFTFLSITYDGKQFYPSRENVDRLKSKIRDICNGKIQYTVLSLLEKIYNVFDGWVSAYFYTSIDRYKKEIDYYLSRQLYLALRKFNWRFTKTAIGKVPRNFRNKGESGDCLSTAQRKNSGIPLLMELVRSKRGE
ncbi:reverse transcriptase domain-containing protein [Imperialibacter roseus]|uniref:Reverse transcriptase domain-containing protein n=1 Tax=Imperialibacter roseus TaxID=1324217 RepID=A0ABZ0IUR0_9BACT|nr:reverse transcriptase domain-containing protein [Imperialibacter roseus]WOK07431.1 reverse transcriptase domain-containing protein [Imperialibacter roseus]